MGGKCNDHYAIPSPIFPHSQSFSQLVHVSFGFLQTKAFAAQAEQIEDEHNYWMVLFTLRSDMYLFGFPRHSNLLMSGCQYHGENCPARMKQVLPVRPRTRIVWRLKNTQIYSWIQTIFHDKLYGRQKNPKTLMIKKNSSPGCFFMANVFGFCSVAH